MGDQGDGFEVHALTGSRLLNGKTGVSANMALEDIGWSTAEHWMRMQASYELARARCTHARDSRQRRSLSAAAL